MVNVAPDTTTEGERPDVSRSDQGAWFEHPRQLKRLFTTEMWERFGYYGMRALLTLYLAEHFLFNDQTTTGLYGGFTALVYLTPLIGGLLADRYLGSKRSVKFGAVMMAVGYFTLCFGGEAAKPYAMVDGQRYEVVNAGEGNARAQYVVAGDQRLQIKGNDDKSVSLLAPDGSEARHIAPGGFEASGERSTLFTLLLLVGLSMVTIGNGFFKPNISTIVGSLYEPGDRRRDAGFTIFYMGINLGSLISQFFCPMLAESVGWWAGFGLAATGMLFSWSLIQFDGGRLSGYGERPPGVDGSRDLAIYAGALVAIPVVLFLFWNLMNSAGASEGGKGLVPYLIALPIMGKILFGTFLIGVPAILVWSYRNGTSVEFQMMLSAMVLIIFNVVFWTLFEQAGSSLTLFADRNTDLALEWTRPLFAMFRATPPTYYLAAALISYGLCAFAWWFFANGEDGRTKRVMGICFAIIGTLAFLGLIYARGGLINQPVYVMPAGQTQIFNALFIVILAPIFSVMWNALAKRGIEPSIPIKFAIALMGVGAGFMFLVWGTNFAGSDFKVGLSWLAGLYLIHSIAELCISPVGLSMITKLSIARIVGMMMGVWFLSISVAQYVAGVVAQVASVETVGGEVTNLKVSLDTYSGVFWTIGLWSAGIGFVLLLISPLLKKWMHGVK
ncbi:MAG: proton-dependent oligopeptide transporter, family [Sphingomonadales bacterium]|jgi:POT family proton-dependent oligopeptide transporter|nr:proton-dependent oligopeptide transporter, family [Sphingomonadales bacterium]